MSEDACKSLVFTMLRHAEDFPWRMQEIGLLGLRLDDRRERRLHVWDPSYLEGEPPVHDHPYNFTSSVVVGVMTNTRYVEDPTGDDYLRSRYSLPDEDDRRTDTVTLSATQETFTEGDEYCQLAHELHGSWQEPGTVTVIRCGWVEPRAHRVSSRRCFVVLGAGPGAFAPRGQGDHRQGLGMVLRGNALRMCSSGVMLPDSGASGLVDGRALLRGERVMNNAGLMASGQRGGWAIAIKGRRDPAAILMIVSERDEAEAIAEEMRTRGQLVEVQRVGMRPGPDAGGVSTPTEPGPGRPKSG